MVSRQLCVCRFAMFIGTGLLTVDLSYTHQFAFVSDLCARRNVRSPEEYLNGHEKTILMSSHNNLVEHQASNIVSLKSYNLAGLRSDETGEIEINFGHTPCFVAITGESGSGKSLLIRKAIDLVTGGKAALSLVPPPHLDNELQNDNVSKVEMVINLREPHLSSVAASLERFGIDSSVIFESCDEIKKSDSCDEQPKVGRLTFERTFVLGSKRLKSICRINGKHLSLKSLREISAPLFTRVDVEAASVALGRPNSRLAMIDIGVPWTLKRKVSRLGLNYIKAREKSAELKRSLARRVLPKSLQCLAPDAENERVELLQHWVDELDIFQSRMDRFRELVETQSNKLNANHHSVNKNPNNDKLFGILQAFEATKWLPADNRSEQSSLFEITLELREAMKTFEAQVQSSNAAYEALASLSSPNSAAVALENTRNLLYSISRESEGPLFQSIEKTHELLNDIEVSLDKCARSIDGDSDSLVSVLKEMSFDGLSISEIDGIIADWNSLARKHDISPFMLPDCHMSLREELDGSVEAQKLLPEAEANEKESREEFSFACHELSQARKVVATKLTRSVTKMLPSLGLDGSTFIVRLGRHPDGIERTPNGSGSLGVDVADFLLLHKKNVAYEDAILTSKEQLESKQSCNIEHIGSSGEKSRILLAIETSLPGSIGASCKLPNNDERASYDEASLQIPPISIIYDEIDAHVGGRAAVTIAKLLVNQARNHSSFVRQGSHVGGSQIIAITHSASVAAIADRHIVIERGTFGRNSVFTPVRASILHGPSRRKEIARMASGDLAPDEAESFAEALIRDGLVHSSTSTYSN